MAVEHCFAGNVPVELLPELAERTIAKLTDLEVVHSCGRALIE